VTARRDTHATSGQTSTRRHMRVLSRSLLIILPVASALCASGARADEHQISPVPVKEGMPFSFRVTGLHGNHQSRIHLTMAIGNRQFFDQVLPPTAVEPSNNLLIFKFSGSDPIPASRTGRELVSVYTEVVEPNRHGGSFITQPKTLAFNLVPHCKPLGQTSRDCQYATPSDWSEITPVGP
jgi:hypothetical protein